MKIPLRLDDRGNLSLEHGSDRIVYKNYNGCFDFVRSADDEKIHYDDKYTKIQPNEITIEDVKRRWKDDRHPSFQVLLSSLGDLHNKSVLLLGNGTSVKELHFLRCGANVVYTDLSIRAVTLMQVSLYASGQFEEFRDKIEFHAVDALHMPFPDGSFDLIYAASFVHHIEDYRLPPLFSEVHRCLKSDGTCRFIDGAYSKIWQASKATFLRPLQRYIHKTKGISPEDLKSTERGGYKREELKQLMNEVGFSKLFFVRHGLFLPLFFRGVGKLLGYDHWLIRQGALTLKFFGRLDDFLSRISKTIHSNSVELIWGFDKEL